MLILMAKGCFECATPTTINSLIYWNILADPSEGESMATMRLLKLPTAKICMSLMGIIRHRPILPQVRYPVGKKIFYCHVNGMHRDMHGESLLRVGLFPV